MVINNYFTSRC